MTTNFFCHHKKCLILESRKQHFTCFSCTLSCFQKLTQFSHILHFLVFFVFSLFLRWNLWLACVVVTVVLFCYVNKAETKKEFELMWYFCEKVSSKNRVMRASIFPEPFMEQRFLGKKLCRPIAFSSVLKGGRNCCKYYVVLPIQEGKFVIISVYVCFFSPLPPLFLVPFNLGGKGRKCLGDNFPLFPPHFSFFSVAGRGRETLKMHQRKALRRFF